MPTTMKEDYYQILGVERTSTEAEIKSAFRRKAMKYHPDRCPGDKNAEEQFKKINEAFSVLSDPQKKQMYDQYGHEGVNGAGGFGGFNAGGFGDINDIFGSVFGDIFGGGFGRAGRGGAPRATRGEDLKLDVTLTLEEAFSGKEVPVEYTRLDNCSECDGSGAAAGSKRKTCNSCRGTGTVTYSQGFFSMRQVCPDCGGKGTVVETPCSACRGSGTKRVKEKITVKIPSGVRTGITLRVSNGGDIGQNGGGFGDLYVEVRVKEHQIFRREGDDLALDAQITYPQAVLGGSIKVPTIEGKEVELNIPKGTQFGSVLKMQGNGMPRLGKKGFGDLLVNVKIEVPKKTTARQKELLEELAKETGGKKSFFKELFS
ncbi:MAG: molecular chaperone DnaJ [Candidatus Avelusimicrobium sp.]|uniref:molecular chaperone DnaJ n=1 Tax=Candidatus Avelusimicrobium sp. TaxID=3048833 RepID=UPI003F094089